MAENPESNIAGFISAFAWADNVFENSFRLKEWYECTPPDNELTDPCRNWPYPQVDYYDC